MTSEITHRPDGTPRHPATVAVLRHFSYSHLPSHLQAVSAPLYHIAVAVANELPDGPDLTCGLRALLEAKDNFVRAKVVQVSGE